MKQSDGLNLSNCNITDVCSEIEKIFKKEKGFFKSNCENLYKRIILFFEGEKIKPFKDNEDEFLNDLMNVLGEPDNWQYKHNTNIVEFKIPPQPLSQVVQIGIALLCVVLFSLLMIWIIMILWKVSDLRKEYLQTVTKMQFSQRDKTPSQSKSFAAVFFCDVL